MNGIFFPLFISGTLVVISIIIAAISIRRKKLNLFIGAVAIFLLSMAGLGIAAYKTIYKSVRHVQQTM